MKILGRIKKSKVLTAVMTAVLIFQSACPTGLAYAAQKSGVRAYAAGHMLDTANDWLGDADEEPITAEQFADRITLSELAFRNDGSIEAYYDDGDIFWGHCIIVRMDKNGNIEDAEIAG